MKRVLIVAAALTLFAAPALAADMPVKAPLMAAAPMFNWTGLYLGATAGYGWGQGRHSVPGLTTEWFDVKGPVAGGTAGFNWQAGNWVAGIETDFSYANMTGHTPNGNFGCGSATDICAIQRKSFGTTRARLGYAFNNLLLYATGGIAYEELHASEGGPAVFRGQNVWRTGPVFGGGIEYGLGANWSAKVEYLRVDVGSYTFAVDGGTPFRAEDGRSNIVRVGLNYRFGGDPWGKTPVVAKY